MKNTRTLTLVLAALAMLGPFATDAYLPSFHSIGAEFQVGQPLVQQTLSVYLFAFAFMSLFWGTLSDSFGRRPIIIISLVLFGIGSVGSALAPSFGWLLFFRGLQGCSAGAGRVVGQALARDLFHGAEAQRLFANIAMVFSLAPAIAPVVGGYLNNHMGWRSTFVLLSLFSVVLLVFSLRKLPETLVVSKRQPLNLGVIARNYFKALSNIQFVMSVIAVGFAFAGFALYISSAANFIMGILKLPETAFAWLFLPFISGMVCGSMINSRFAGRIHPTIMIRAGLSILALGALLNVLYNSLFIATVPWAVLPIFVYAFGMSMALPGMTVITLNTFPKMLGLASSLQSAVQMLIFAVVSGFVAPLLFESALLLALGMGASAVLCIGLWSTARSVTLTKISSR
ncbi:Bcr/CflA family efflux MFS transporter [Candidimonas sp. SYP-B2681]|uniref:multidrug effflux MFS transporter n=1 Tax=Candidimonas sp. SYP-B2681 TaxID=2497686 RepID=UPI000F88E7FA|nr:multidrug effflux MFS transporter [Candidimonas sp. SYP-B2681]RTZ41564.1 Bcr/CflA family efflux MFS transporter [Candidimonas sp. SYP-B2681]